MVIPYHIGSIQNLPQNESCKISPLDEIMFQFAIQELYQDNSNIQTECLEHNKKRTRDNRKSKVQPTKMVFLKSSSSSNKVPTKYKVFVYCFDIDSLSFFFFF